MTLKIMPSPTSQTKNPFTTPENFRNVISCPSNEENNGTL
jgi:hypothetical protein